MFDQHVHRSGPEHVDVTVNEQRAPTDASVKLLMEMREAAEKSILATIRLDSNNFKGVIHKRQEWINDEFVYAIMFELNGVKHNVKHTVPMSLQDNRKIAESLVNGLSRYLAAEILCKVIEEKEL